MVNGPSPGPRWGAPETPEQRRRRLRKIGIFVGLGGLFVATVATLNVINPSEPYVAGPEKGDCVEYWSPDDPLTKDRGIREISCDDPLAHYRVLVRIDGVADRAESAAGCKQQAPTAEAYFAREAGRTDPAFTICLKSIDGRRPPSEVL